MLTTQSIKKQDNTAYDKNKTIIIMKHLTELTLIQFEQYKELVEEEKPDWYSIFLLFDLDINDMEVNELIDYQTQLGNMYLNTIGVFDEYVINGQKYKLIKNITEIKAVQFIDFQTYLVNNNLHEMLSIFLIPMYLDKQTPIQKLLKKQVWKTHEYGTNYDIKKVQDELYNHLTIGKANDMAAFFLTSSTILLDSMRVYLEKKNQFQTVKPQLQ